MLTRVSMLNFGIQIPPIPCSSCIPGGWLQPTPSVKRRGAPSTAIELDPAHSVMSDATPIPGMDYWPRGDARWTKHTHGKVTGHRPRVQSVLKELKVDQMHKRTFYESFKKGTERFSEHVSSDEMTSFFKKKRARFEARLENYLAPWRQERIEWQVRERWERRGRTSPNPGHPSHLDKPWIHVLTQVHRSKFAPVGNKPFFSVRQDADAAHLWEKEEDAHKREVISPTEPPISGCDPIPPCFDTCDLIRATVIFLEELTILVTDVFFALIQDWDIAFPYFVTGDVSICSEICPTVDKNAPDCKVACPGINISLEEDLRQAVVAFADVFRAICNVLNLIIPVEIPGIITERPDLCCSVVRLGDLVACILLVIIKGIKSLALENDSGFPYFTQGLFLMDVDLLFDLTFDLVVCLCNIVRAVFPVQNVADLDICCIVQNGAMVIIELAQWAFQIVISLGTIQTSGNAYFVDPACGWTDSGCDPNVNNIGFVVQADIAFDSFFGAEGGACSNSFSTSGGCGDLHGKDMGQGGVITCVCQLVTTIFPVRPSPGEPTSNDNCPIVDMCCILRRGGFAANSLLKFAIRLVATTWQRWEGNPILPTGFISFWFCDELTAPPGSPCGQFNPIIDNIVSLVDQCLCEFFALVDAFFGNAWPGWSCFCGPFDGIFCGIAGVVRTVIRLVIELFRRINDPTYWQIRRDASQNTLPIGLTGGTYVPFNDADTWAMRFFGPMVLEFCRFASSLVCFLQVIIPKCTITRAHIMNSFVVWVGEFIIRIAEFIEGFVLAFAGRGCSGSNNDSNGYGFNTQCLTGVLVSLLAFPVDALIADAGVVCYGGGACDCINEGLGGDFYTPSNANYAQITNNRCVLNGQEENIPDSEAGYTDCATIIFGILPQCAQRCTPLSRFGDRCVDIELPLCFNRVGGIEPIDGIIMAATKYFRCMLAIIFPFFADYNPADMLVLVFTIIWQISRAVINFIAALIVFFFTLFTIGSGIGGCRCHNGTLSLLRGALCYNCRDDLDNSVDATPGVSDVIVPQGSQFKSNNCCLKSTYSSTPGTENCDGTPRSSTPQIICSGLQLVGAFFNLLSAFVGIFTAFTRIVTPDPMDIPTARSVRTRGPVYGPMTEDDLEAYQEYKQHASKRYHALRSRYNQTHSDEPAKYAFRRWVKGSRDPHSRSRHHFKKRAESVLNSVFMGAGLYEHGLADGEAAGEIPEVLMDALFGFDTDDCMDDPIACICRNMDVPDVCTWDVEHDEPISNTTVSTVDVMNAMVIIFDNHTVCDAVIRDMDNIPWIEVPFAIRAEYMECLELRIQGERIRDMYAGFPADMFYSPKDGMPELMFNLHRDWNWMYTVDINKTADEERAYQREYVYGTEFEGFEDRLKTRLQENMGHANNAKNVGERNALRFLARLDQFDHKLNQGFYSHHVGRAFDRLKRGEHIQPVSMLRRVKVVGDHMLRSGSLMMGGITQMTELPALTWNVGVQTSLLVRDMYTRGTGTVLSEGWDRYTDALAQDARERDGPSEAYIKKRKVIHDAVTNGPFYQWMFNPNATQNTRGSSPLHATIIAPFARFNKHLTAVFDHQRAKATNGTEVNIFNLWGAQKQWDALKGAFWKRWEARPLTRAQRENRARGWRVMNKIKYMWNPASVPREVYEKFIFGCDCEVVDGTLALLVDVVNYCANSFVPNLPTLKRIANDLLYRNRIFGNTWSQRVFDAANFSTQQGHLSKFVEKIEPMVRDTNYTFKYRRHHKSRRNSKTQYRMEAWPIPQSDSEFYYIRPRIVNVPKPRPLHRDLSKIDARQWRRNRNSGEAARFNLIVWFSCLIDEIFDTEFTMSMEQWFMDLEEWFENPTCDPADLPDVGFKCTSFLNACAPRRGRAIYKTHSDARPAGGAQYTHSNIHFLRLGNVLVAVRIPREFGLFIWSRPRKGAGTDAHVVCHYICVGILYCARNHVATHDIWYIYRISCHCARNCMVSGVFLQKRN